LKGLDDIVKFLLERNADVNIQNRNDWTALILGK
jgi:ankyrin repeat protein